MSGLPDDLRSLANNSDALTTGYVNLVLRAADELDARAARILRLEEAIRAMRVRGEVGLGHSHTVEGPDEVVVTPEHHATRWYDAAGRLVIDQSTPPGVIEIRQGERVIARIYGIGS